MAELVVVLWVTSGRLHVPFRSPQAREVSELSEDAARVPAFPTSHLATHDMAGAMKARQDSAR